MAFPTPPPLPPKSLVKNMFHHTNTTNQTSSYQLHTNYRAHDEVEFDFWGQYDDNNSSSHGDDTEETPKFKENVPLWGKAPSKNVRFESSFPLLPHTPRYSDMSTNSRLHTIAEGRRQLMEMVRGMPESNYELSLKDLVDKQHVQDEDEMAIEEKSTALNSESQINNLKAMETRNISRSGPISRSGSMGKETFMIKMYVPTSLSWKAKTNTGLGARVTSGTPLFVSEKHDEDKDGWIKRIFLAGAGSRRSNSSRSTSSSSSSVDDGFENTSFFHGCYPFSCYSKSKGKRIRGNIC